MKYEGGEFHHGSCAGLDLRILPVCSLLRWRWSLWRAAVSGSSLVRTCLVHSVHSPQRPLERSWFKRRTTSKHSISFNGVVVGSFRTWLERENVPLNFCCVNICWAYRTFPHGSANKSIVYYSERAMSAKKTIQHIFAMPYDAMVSYGDMNEGLIRVYVPSRSFAIRGCLPHTLGQPHKDTADDLQRVSWCGESSKWGLNGRRWGGCSVRTYLPISTCPSSS